NLVQITKPGQLDRNRLEGLELLPETGLHLPYRFHSSPPGDCTEELQPCNRICSALAALPVLPLTAAFSLCKGACRWLLQLGSPDLSWTRGGEDEPGPYRASPPQRLR